MNVVAVGPAASTVRSTSTTWSQKSGTLPRLWVETSIRWPCALSSRSRSMMAVSVLTSTPVNGSSSRMIRPFLGQRAGQEHALPLAARQLADLALAERGHADALQRLVDLAPVARRGHAQEAHAAVAAHHHDVVDQHREVPVDVLGLRHVGDEVALLRLARRRARRCGSRRRAASGSP